MFPSFPQMTTVLDQKSYIEELNRHLTATVASLEAKVESLTTTNALMSEDLAITKLNLLKHKEAEQAKKRKPEGVTTTEKVRYTL